ncbi:hypothetical protein E8E13_001554 [Curvularia kusanoi]|uniref:NAD(P)-binding protein n=1 Tax=Curvularia kusanoi TaxID=90978 RepID=A0A9P4T5B5_CURKU|nr:hypothetical protein E8E13_001554 [Curvularia kusanoi]
MPTAVVTGANSGIGNALARILVKQGYKVIAVDINIGAPIAELGCETLKLDVSSRHDIEAFKDQMADRPIDLLLNVAGVMYPQDSDTLDKVTLTKLQKTFAVNTFGPLLLTQALLPSIEKSERPVVAVMSSRVGSIGDNFTGGMYAYRSSKTAANMLFYNLSIDLKPRKITVLVLHPGIVKTNMDRRWSQGGNKDVQGAVEPEVAASDLWKVLMSKGLESTGKFFHRNGDELPW